MTAADPAPARPIRCTQCALTLDSASFDGGASVECPACRSVLMAVFFPAFEKPPATVSASTGERALDGEATCYFHPEKRATLACEGCGRFLCALCDMPLGARHLCPSCLSSDRRAELVPQRVCWSRVTLALGFLPFIVDWMFFPFFIFTGLLTIFTGLWTWRKPGSLVHGPRHGAAIVGMLGGLVQLAVVGGLIFFMIWGIQRAFK